MTALRTIAAFAIAALLLLAAIDASAAHAALEDTAAGVPAAHVFQDDAANGDSRVEVQVWTLLAAGGAMSIGLVLFTIRAIAGRVQPPPPQDNGDHH